MRTPDDPGDKRAWRRAARAARRGLDRAAWAADLVEALRAWPPYRRAGTVATFLAFGDEPDLSPLHGDGPRFCVPRVNGVAGGLTLHPLGGPLERHRMGMDEPAADAPRIDPAEVDLALVPGLAFDLRGVRIGYGGGHYDRLLPRLRPTTPRAGVAHPALLAEELPVEAHDVRLSHLVLPGGVVAVGGQDARRGAARSTP